MRLTLRTLLAYLDDTLEPAEIRTIGQKVTESDKAQEMIARIKQVTRKRRLTTPPVTGPKGLDANEVAEYLDNVLPADRVGELEQVAIESDVHLAEIAASHQILTLVQGEPALVPPSARQRFYELVQGKESARRKATKLPPRPAAPVLSGDPDADETLLLGLPVYQKSPWLLWALPAAAVVVLGLMVLFLALASPRRSSSRPGTELAVAPTTATAPTPPTGATQPQPPTTSPSTGTPPPPPPPPPQPVDPPLVDANLPPREPSKERKEVGRFKLPKDPQVLVRKSAGKDRFERVAPEVPVYTSEPLVCLPGYQADITTPGVELRLFGFLDDLYGWHPVGSEVASPPRECALTPHVAPEKPEKIDLEFTLDRGRVYLTNLEKEAAIVRVRFAGQVWDVTLEEPGTRVALQLASEFSPFYSPRDDDEPLVEMDLLVEQGVASVKYGYRSHGLLGLTVDNRKVRNRIRWDNKQGKFAPVTVEGEVPEFTTKPLSLDIQKQMRAPLEELAMRMTGQAGVESAIRAGVKPDRPLDASLCIRCLGAVDAVEELLDLLDSSTMHANIRQKAIFALRGYVNRGQAAVKQLYDSKTKTGLLIQKQYKEPEAVTVLYFLRIFFVDGRGQAEVYRSLIDHLLHDKLAVRELAYWHLRFLAGDQGIRYDAAGDKPSREAAATEWKRLLSTGKIPPRTP